MKIGTRISPEWLQRPDDLRFLKQIGVDCVDITLDIVPGYDAAGGVVPRNGMEQLVEALDKVGLVVERANTFQRYIDNVYWDGPDAERQIENLCQNIEVCGEYKMPVFGIQCSSSKGDPGFQEDVYSRVEGRGGYKHLRVDVSRQLNKPRVPSAPTAEQLWERTLRIYHTVLPVAESNRVKVAMHGNDPPVPRLGGYDQVLYNFAAFDRLFRDAASPNNGMTFCVGTRYESGENVFEGIRHFGGQGKIFHVHFRNVNGTIPVRGAYDEVMPDLGDLDMYQVAKALHDVGYDGAIDYDHIHRVVTDSPQGREYIAYCVGYMRGILQSLESNVSKKPGRAAR